MGERARPRSVLDEWGPRYKVSPERLYTDFKQMLEEQQPDIVSVVTQPEHRAAILIHCAGFPSVKV